jgi:sugar-specific transcriptional regulator TrmB
MDKNELSETFRKIGLSDKESLVYSCLLSLGGAFPSKIAEETKLNRSTVYKILLDLSIKGLVNEIKKRNKAYYQVERPDKLVRYVKTQVTIANEHVERVQKLLPDIEGLFSLIPNKPKISYFESIEGILSIYEDQINVTKKYEMLAFSNASELENVFPEKFFENYRKTKEKIGITTRGIIPNTDMDQTFTERMYAGYKKEVIPQTKQVPASEFSFKGEIVVYRENKVSIVNLNKEYLTGLIIEDITIHNMMKMIFELSWKGIK